MSAVIFLALGGLGNKTPGRQRRRWRESFIGGLGVPIGMQIRVPIGVPIGMQIRMQIRVPIGMRSLAVWATQT